MKSLHLYIPPISHTQRVRHDRPQLVRAFWVLIFCIVAACVLFANPTSMLGLLGAALIGIAALIPSYLWVSGRALGLPIFPIFTLTYLWTYALQILSKHPIVSKYSPDQQFKSSFTVVLFLAIATIFWYSQVSKAPPQPKSYRAFQSSKSKTYFLVILFLGGLFTMAVLGGWFHVLGLGGGSFALIRGLILGLVTLAVFTLSVFWSSQQLSRQEVVLFISLLYTYIISNAASLLLVGSMSILATHFIAIIVSRGKIPWKMIAISLTLFSILHIGKGEMRKNYWGQSQASFVQPWQYPRYFSQWLGYSFENLMGTLDQPNQQSISERLGLMHILLMTETRTPHEITFLKGETYKIIPQLLIPRIFNENKIRSHEGTYILNIHYGMQRREDTFTTTIGWGLLNEAYANFGVFGCMGLGLILGWFYGRVTQMTIHSPPSSFQYLFGVLVLGFAIQTEFSAGVYVAALYQGTVSLIIISIVFMKKVSHLSY